MNDESSPKAALANPAVAAGFTTNSPISAPTDGVTATIESPIVRHHGDCEACRWMTAEIRRLYGALSTRVDQAQRIERDGREIETLASELIRARHEVERLRGVLNRHYVIGAAA